MKYRIISFWIILLTVFLGFFVYASETKPGTAWGNFPFQFGLDLSGGTELIYEADTSALADHEIDGAMSSLKRVIERRVNAFGVGQPIVQTETAGLVTGDHSERLIVELPGITDLERATDEIGETPVLDFRLVKESQNAISHENIEATTASGTVITMDDVDQSNTATGTATTTLDEIYEPTGLTGRYLEDARLEFNHTTGDPYVSLSFNDDGADLFAEITGTNQGRMLAIFLDGEVISSPVIQTEIRGGEAQISGGFHGADGREEARELANNLRFGALPVPIELLSSQTIGATLGENTLQAGIVAGIIGLSVVALFLVLWYRVSGLIAVLSLLLYILIMLTLFKLIPVTLTSAGIAGFILSVGMAVDANVLIFERIKEERRSGKLFTDAIQNGFSRAWPSIRDANISSMISAVILYWMGTSLIKGFALVFGIGVLVSMITAISVTRTYLQGVVVEKVRTVGAFLFGTGIRKE